MKLFGLELMLMVLWVSGLMGSLWLAYLYSPSIVIGIGIELLYFFITGLGCYICGRFKK